MSMRIYALTQLDETTKILDASLLRTLKPHTSPVVTTTVDSTSTLLATGSADGSIKIWDIRGGFVTHTFHGHGGVISALCFFQVVMREQNEGSTNDKSNQQCGILESFDSTSTVTFRLASGSEEGKVRVWDLHKRKSIANLDSHVSVVRSLTYSITENVILSASRDKTIILWDARTFKIRRIIPVLESVETAGYIAASPLIFMGGENGKLRIWNGNRGTEVTKDQEAGSELEAISASHYAPGMPFIVTVHADQTLRLHDLSTIVNYKPSTSLNPLEVVRRVSGNDDEVIDLAFVGADRSMVALATNTESIKIISIDAPDKSPNSGYFGAEVTYLDGHEDIIICLDVDWSGHWLATGAKDNTARLWRLDPKNGSYKCIATFTGHAESLGAVLLPRAPPSPSSSAYNDPVNYPPAFLFTGSQDRTIKRWDTRKLSVTNPSAEPQNPKAAYTRKAHDKDINALDIDSASMFLASASQDRTVKIWSAEDGSVVGILRGHKRGVWSVRFAPKDIPIISATAGSSSSRGVIATASGDKTVKLWNLSDYSCLVTFEGHTNSVLKTIWLPPTQVSINNDEESQLAASRHTAATRPLIASAAADGLVKIWSPYTGELETTLDNHTDRVWALASPFPSGSREIAAPSLIKGSYSPPYDLASGAADSTVSFWTNTTWLTLTSALTANSARIEQDQQLQNYIRSGAYREAIVLALQLNHPGRLLSLFTSAIEEADSKRALAHAATNKVSDGLTGDPSIDRVLQSLDKNNLYTLLLRVRDWNTNARTAKVAQRILYALVRSYPPSTFLNLAKTQPPEPNVTNRISQEKANTKVNPAMKDVLNALAAYTDRHYRRLEDLVDESFLVEWILDEMDGGVGLGMGTDTNMEDESSLSLNWLSKELGDGKDVVMLGV
jgi:U3 small nucleolar RNA-associated protein 13